MTEVTPGNWIDVPPRRPGATRVQRYVACADGKLRWVDEDDWERLTPPNVARLKLGVDYLNLRRLCIAGFVATRRPVPRSTSFSVQSYFDHCDRIDEAVAAGQEFWTGQRLEALRDALRKYVRWADRDTSLAAPPKNRPRPASQAARAGRPPSSPVPEPSVAS